MKDPETDFYTNALERFLDTYSKYTSDEMNSNTDEVFYDKTKYKKMMETMNNELELTWRRRQMNVTTPRGNIIMFYDAYKMGFSYYGDKFISYKILNAAAMKYVTIYRCRDLFVDESVLPDNHRSSLINIHHEAEQIANPSNRNAIIGDHAPFAKLKPQTNAKKTEEVRSKHTNTFIHAGILRDYTPLQKPKKINSLNGFKSNAIPPQIMTYKQYKAKGIPIQE